MSLHRRTQDAYQACVCNDFVYFPSATAGHRASWNSELKLRGIRGETEKSSSRSSDKVFKRLVKDTIFQHSVYETSSRKALSNCTQVQCGTESDTKAEFSNIPAQFARGPDQTWAIGKNWLTDFWLQQKKWREKVIVTRQEAGANVPQEL